MTRNELKELIREEVRSLLNKEFNDFLNAAFLMPEDHPDAFEGRVYTQDDDEYKSCRKVLNHRLRYFYSLEEDLRVIENKIDRKVGEVWQSMHHVQENIENVAEAMWPGHGVQDEGDFSRPDWVHACIKKYKGLCRNDPKYKKIRLANIDEAVEHFKEDPKGLWNWLRYWSFCPYPEKPWSGEAHIDLGPDTPERNRRPTDYRGM